MSNVLIGIIGVILFIGLALAGALFLGPRFQQSTNVSKAAASIQALKQVADAANLYEMQEGQPLTADNYMTNVQTLADKGYLKTAVKDPIDGSTIYTVDDEGFGRAIHVHHLWLAVGASADTAAREICKEIERQSGSRDPEAAMARISTTDGWGQRIASRPGPGCMLYATTANPQGTYSAYLPL